MAFEAKNFVLCSKFNLFKAHCNLWIYCTGDTLEQCMAENYFQPRRNLKNQDSPEVGDVIQLVVEHSKLAYLKIVAKTEQPYNITVARTFLENEATLLSLITALQLDKAGKVEDFVSAITDTNKGLTQVEQAEIEQKIDLAANSGRMITQQGFWYAKMYAATVAPSAEDGTNYADFSQVDGQGNPIIVTYNRVNGAWVQDQTITPPADYDGYVPITSKIWDIPEQDGQQGGRILWNHTSKQFTPYPQIINFESVNLTGNSTVEMPANPTDDNIANVEFVLDHAASRNVGDIFLTSRTDSVLNGAVPCDGTTYQTTDYTGSQAPGVLLQGGKIPYVSLATYATLLSTQGYCDRFGWDGVGTTAFRVPTLDLHHAVVEVLEPTSANPYWYRRYADGWVEQGGIYVASANEANVFVPFPLSMADTNYTLTTTYTQPTAWESNTGNTALNVTCRLAGSTNRKLSNGFYFNSVGVDGVYSWRVSGKASVGSKTLYQRAMVQLSFGARDESYTSLAEVAYTGDYGDLLNKPELATVATSGSYNDLSNKPTIPTVGNGTITITQGGVTKGTFTTNQSGNTTIDVDAGGTTIRQSIDAEIVGTLTVNNSTVSGFSDTDYLTIPGILDLNQDFEIGFSFTTPRSLGLLMRRLFSLSNSTSGFSVVTWNGTNLYIYINGNLSTGSLALSSDTKYWVKVTRVGNVYTLYSSTDGTTYTSVSTITTADTLLVGKYAFKLWNPSVPGVSAGTLYMEDAYILLNGIRVWQGMDSPGLHQRVPTGHEVIEFQAPTSSNNYTWYRKYADGWVEQGGISTTGLGTSGTITLPITMQDNNYTAIAGNGNNAANNYFTISRPEATTTTIKWYKSSSSMNGYWEVKGMAAS